ncbi:MAG: hypothetical protein IH986_02525, partial [Planctomycetes bacterium]|nr:hypothetical protein [Planctomycetota bacterium]
ADDRYGKFIAEPLMKGYGATLGNPLRRILYSSLPGTAVTWVKIEGVLHEYTTIPHVKEEVSELLMNIRGVRLRSSVELPGKLRLEVAGQGEVSAGDIMASSDFEVVNPELHLATLDSDEARLSVELNVERGTGYSEASQIDGLPIGVLPVDAGVVGTCAVQVRRTVRIHGTMKRPNGLERVIVVHHPIDVARRQISNRQMRGVGRAPRTALPRLDDRNDVVFIQDAVGWRPCVRWIARGPGERADAVAPELAAGLENRRYV